MSEKVEINGWKYKKDDPEIGKFLDGSYKLLENVSRYYPLIDENFNIIFTTEIDKEFKNIVVGIMPAEKYRNKITRNLSSISYFEKIVGNLPSILKNTSINAGSSTITVVFKNETVAKSLGFVESFSDSIFYDKELKPRESHLTTKSSLKIFNFTQKYNVSDYSPEEVDEIKKMRDDNKIKLDFDFIYFYNKYLKPYSYGVELEYSLGYLRHPHYASNGFLGLRDGSVTNTGSELASLPIFNHKDLYHVKSVMDLLKDRCEVDKSCSIHIHMGNLRFDNIFIQNIYNVMVLLQDELIKCFPNSRQTGNSDGKIYCGKLKDLKFTTDIADFKNSVKNNVERIYKTFNKNTGFECYKDEYFLVDVENGYKRVRKKEFYSKKANKSKYDKTSKWNIDCRYHNLNFFNFLFRKNKTLEFRLMEGSTSFNAFINWLATCVAIINYAERVNPLKLSKKLTLNDVITAYYPSTLAKKLNMYWENRKTLFATGANFNNEALNNWKIY